MTPSALIEQVLNRAQYSSTPRDAGSPFMTRRLPPFGRRVAAILRDPAQLAKFSGCTRSRGTVWLIAGPGAWDKASARPRHLCIVLPDGDDPAGYSWSFLRGHDPILLDGPHAEDTDRRREIAAAIFRDGVPKVLAGSLLMVAPRVAA